MTSWQWSCGSRSLISQYPLSLNTSKLVLLQEGFCISSRWNICRLLSPLYVHKEDIILVTSMWQSNQCSKSDLTADMWWLLGICRESQVVQQNLSTHIYINVCSSGSSSRMALVWSSITIPTEVTDSEWTLSNKMTLISLHPPGIQCSSPVTRVEPKQMVPKPHSSPNRDYEAVLQRFDCIALESWKK